MPKFYTIHETSKLKIAAKCDFICSIQNIFVSLQP